MSRKPFGELTELGQARRLRPLAEAALRAYDLEPTGLRLISNGWNCVFRIDTPAGRRVVRITRPVPGADDRSVRSEVEFMSALAANTDVAVPAVIHNHAGELVTVAEAEGVPEPRECVVFGWLGGPDLAARRSATSWARLGELMATMHRFAEDWTPTASFSVAHYDSCLPYGEKLVVFEPGRVDLDGLEGILRDAVDVHFARSHHHVDVDEAAVAAGLTLCQISRCRVSQSPVHAVFCHSSRRKERTNRSSGPSALRGLQDMRRGGWR